MKIFFRTSGGEKKGWGNIYRIITLCKFFEKKIKIKPILIFEGNAKVRDFIKKYSINYVHLKSNISISQELKFLEKLGKPDILIIEMLNLNKIKQLAYSKYAKKNSNI